MVDADGSTPIVEQHKEGKAVIKRALYSAWDDYTAEQEWRLAELVFIDGKLVLAESTLEKSSGDAEWAKRIASHYGLKLDSISTKQGLDPAKLQIDVNDEGINII